MEAKAQLALLVVAEGEQVTSLGDEAAEVVTAFDLPDHLVSVLHFDWEQNFEGGIDATMLVYDEAALAVIVAAPGVEFLVGCQCQVVVGASGYLDDLSA